MNENEMISKKDLLQRYGISYGALYRWKRMGLIPDDWFVKTASITGQQTFFPRRLVCERIEQIMGMKDGVSLSELADSYKEKEEKESYLTVTTDFGTTKFRMSEIRKVYVTNETGTTVLIERNGEI
ncbi:MAG: DUF4004 family protein [Clostridia bacterium]|nr:DUF4004 family protein [Clostridia bacterium]